MKQLRHLPAALLAVVFTVCTGGTMMLRYWHYYPFNQDFTYRLQAFWQYLQGGRLVETVYGGHLFHFHFEPVIMPLVWLFGATGQRPEVLLLVQATAMALAGLAWYALACHWFERLRALGVLLVFYLYQPVLFGTVFVFAPLVLAVPLLSWAWYFLLARRRVGIFATLTLLAILCQEVYCFIAVLSGCYLLLLRRWHAGAILIAAGSMLFLFIVGVFLPHFRTDPNLHAGTEITTWWYGGLQAETVPELLAVSGRELLRPLTATYAAQLLLPLLLVPLAAPRLLLSAVLAALPYCLSQFTFTREIYTYYPLLLVPMLMAAFCSGLRVLDGKLRCGARRAGGAILMLAVVTGSALAVFSSPFVPVRSPFAYFPGIYDNPRQATLDEAMSAVPDGAGVLTLPVLSEHLFRRERLTVIFTDNILDPREEYIVMDLREFNWIVDIEPVLAPVWLQSLRACLHDGRYEIVYYRAGVLVARRTERPVPLASLPRCLEEEFAAAFRRTFAAVGCPSSGEVPFIYGKAERRPGRLPIFAGGTVTLPVIAGGYWPGQRQFSRLTVRTIDGRTLDDVVAPSPALVLRIPLDLLPEGAHTLTVHGEDRAGGDTWFMPVHIDRTPPVLALQHERDGTMFLTAHDTGSPCEVYACRRPAGETEWLTVPLQRRWRSAEMADVWHPFPGGTGSYREMVTERQLVDWQGVAAADYAGNTVSLSFSCR